MTLPETEVTPISSTPVSNVGYGLPIITIRPGFHRISKLSRPNFGLTEIPVEREVASKNGQ